jgi:D-glycero-D-manno-heptose 1,7-bisphosphate phosphatase
MNRAVFLDRDGVITRSLVRDGRPYAPTTLDDFAFLPGVGDAIQDLKNAGFRLVVVTNQPDVATGTVRRDIVEAMHGQLRAAFPVDAIKVCYHVDQDNCDCRKPKPGMLLEAAAELQIDLSQSFMVGDRWRDIGAGKAAGCKTILIESGYEERQADSPDAVAADLPQACTLILSERI